MEITNNLERRNEHIFKAVTAGAYSLSIQGSSGHYCSPKSDSEKSSTYYAMEMAIYNGGRFPMNPRKSSIIRAFPRYMKLMGYYDDHGVFGWLPVDLIDDLYNYLKK